MMARVGMAMAIHDFAFDSAILSSNGGASNSRIAATT
jgi:hypothetical protein